MIPEESANLLGVHDNIKVAVFSEFIKYFEDVTHVIIDGELKDSLISRTRSNIKPIDPYIKGEAEADTTYKVVNIADQIARMLHRYYASFKGRRDGTKYSSHLLIPDLRVYASSSPKLSPPNLEKRLKYTPIHRQPTTIF